MFKSLTLRQKLFMLYYTLVDVTVWFLTVTFPIFVVQFTNDVNWYYLYFLVPFVGVFAFNNTVRLSRKLVNKLGYHNFRTFI